MSDSYARAEVNNAKDTIHLGNEKWANYATKVYAEWYHDTQQKKLIEDKNEGIDKKDDDNRKAIESMIEYEFGEGLDLSRFVTVDDLQEVPTATLDDFQYTDKYNNQHISTLYGQDQYLNEHILTLYEQDDYLNTLIFNLMKKIEEF